MVGSDPLDSIGTMAEAAGEARDDEASGGGWELIAEYDGAAALVGALLQINPETEHTRTELSNASGVAYKTLYLDGTVEALVEAGLLERTERDGEETTFSVDRDSEMYGAAEAFGQSVTRSRQADSS